MRSVRSQEKISRYASRNASFASAMNVMWRATPKLLSAYDRYMLRSFIAYRAGEVYAVIDEDEESSRCRYSNAEIWILVACIGLHAYSQCRKANASGAAEAIWTDLAISLLRAYGKEGLAESTAPVKWDTVGHFFRWFGTKVEERFMEYATALDADMKSAASNPNFWSGELNERVLQRVFIREGQRDEGRYELRAYEISSFLFAQAYPSILDLLTNPSLRRLGLGWYSSLVDSFWVTYRARSQQAPSTEN
jgi:hypothetical protein